ncbi:DUF6148 family protein [Pyramidobacter piscolens]|uniref:DUF6148 family protein n=1 Tax=Pyramidobacter piscolens TaxID=638849 RepID=UPI00248FC073|nr:DUF6148 family protein [Pyramidobacter piscolens]
MTLSEKIAEAEKHLQAWKEADLHLARGSEYRMGTRVLKLVDVQYVKSMIQYWQNQLNALNGAGRKRHFHIVPVDL